MPQFVISCREDTSNRHSYQPLWKRSDHCTFMTHLASKATSAASSAGLRGAGDDG